MERLPSEFDLGEVDPGSITVKLDDPEIVALMNRQTKLIAAVTGGSSYLGMTLIKQLVAEGFYVRATVRPGSLEVPEKMMALVNLVPNTEVLQVYEADLRADGAFDEVVHGAHYVFHLASPAPFDASADPSVIEDSVFGVRNVLRACWRSKSTVRRVVLTSTARAVAGMNNQPKNGEYFTEEDWADVIEGNDLDKCAIYQNSHVLSEREAWKYAGQLGLDLVTICSSFTLGPPEAAFLRNRPSVKYMVALLTNKDPGQEESRSVCDIRDVARVHVHAALTPSAQGRYIVASPYEVSTSDICEILNKVFTQRTIFRPPKSAQPREDKKLIFDISKVQRDLGFDPTDLYDTVKDMALKCIELGLVEPSLGHDRKMERSRTSGLSDMEGFFSGV